VLFVCLHGSAKSVIAAEHLRRIARELHLVVDVSPAGVEADSSIPAGVVAGLAADGFDVDRLMPRQLSAEAIAAADTVVSFGCNVPTPNERTLRVLRWDDVPAVSEGYARARDVILLQLNGLVHELR